MTKNQTQLLLNIYTDTSISDSLLLMAGGGLKGSSREFDGLLRLRDILIDAKHKNVDEIKLPKSAYVILESGDIVHLDGHLKPPDADQHNRTLLIVREDSDFYYVSLRGNKTDSSLDELTNRISDLSSDDFSQKSNSQSQGRTDAEEVMQIDVRDKEDLMVIINDENKSDSHIIHN